MQFTASTIALLSALTVGTPAQEPAKADAAFPVANSEEVELASQRD